MNASPNHLCRHTMLRREMAAYIILLLTALFLVWRCFYSFCWSDESFYLTMVHRLWIGERMFADEWYTAQLSAPLSLPFYALYRRLVGSSDGVYLCFRLLYVAISTAAALFLYRTLRRANGLLPSMLCALLYLLYSRANIGGLTYYNMTLTYVLLAAALCYRQLCRRKTSVPSLLLMGVCIALATVTTPFLALPCFLLSAGLLLSRKRWLLHPFLIVCAGIAIAAVLYLTYILLHVTPAEIRHNLPYVLEEPELQRTNPLLAVPLIFARIAWRYKWTIWGTLAILFYLYRSHRTGQLLTPHTQRLLLSFNLLLFAVNFILSANLLGCILIAGVLFALPLLYAFTLSEPTRAAVSQSACAIDERPQSARSPLQAHTRNLLFSFGLAGLSLILAFTFSSDTGLDGMTIGFLPLCCCALLILWRSPLLKQSALLHGAVLAVSLLLVLQTGALRLCSVYRDAPLPSLTAVISDGPARGLRTTPEHEKEYRSVLQAVRTYVRPGDTVLYTQMCFWAYLCTDSAYGTPTSWRITLDSPRLAAYYRQRPDKIPTCVFVMKPSIGSFQSSLIQGNEHIEEPNFNTESGFLWDYMKENHYEKSSPDCADVYRLP